MEALIASEQTPSVMGMLSGCYLVLCGNEIASHLYRYTQTLEGPWPLPEQGPVGCKGDFNQPAVWQRKGVGGTNLPGNCEYRKWNDWQQIGGSFVAKQFNRARESNMWFEKFFFFWSSCLDRTLNVLTGWQIKCGRLELKVSTAN